MEMSTGKGAKKGTKIKRILLRKRIRDTKRLLLKDGLPDHIRESKARALEMYEEEFAQRKEERKAKNFNHKYKMVKFFDRKKIQRRLKALLKELKDAPSDGNAVHQIQQLRADLNYVMHYPLSEHCYYSLYPTTPSSRNSIEERARIYRQVLEDVSSGALNDVIHDPTYIGEQYQDIVKDLPPIDTTLLPTESSVTRKDNELENTKGLQDEGSCSQKSMGDKRKKMDAISEGLEERSCNIKTRKRKLKSELASSPKVVKGLNDTKEQCKVGTGKKKSIPVKIDKITESRSSKVNVRTDPKGKQIYEESSSSKDEDSFFI